MHPVCHVLPCTWSLLSERQGKRLVAGACLLMAPMLCLWCWYHALSCVLCCLQGAATEVYLAISPDIKGGEYYADCNISPSTAESQDKALGERLWEMSEKMVAAV